MNKELIVFVFATVVMLVAAVVFAFTGYPELIEYNNHLADISEKLDECDCFGARGDMYKLPGASSVSGWTMVNFSESPNDTCGGGS